MNSSICSHPEPVYNNYDYLLADGTTGHEKIVCKECKSIWRPGDTRTHLAEYPFRFEKDVHNVANATRLSWDDMKSRLAVPTAI